jgi:Ca2+-binding RTX toxin-like protein
VRDDTIELSSAIFTAFATTGSISPGAFNIGAAASEADDRIIYNAGTGALIYDSNGNVAGGATQFAVLSAGLALTANDFVVI